MDNWDHEIIDGKKEYMGHDRLGANFRTIHNFQARVVQRENGQYVTIHNQATPEYDDKLKEYML
eukprot:10112648-Karenia_brevis.AAC.1